MANEMRPGSTGGLKLLFFVTLFVHVFDAGILPALFPFFPFSGLQFLSRFYMIPGFPQFIYHPTWILYIMIYFVIWFLAKDKIPSRDAALVSFLAYFWPYLNAISLPAVKPVMSILLFFTPVWVWYLLFKTDLSSESRIFSWIGLAYIFFWMFILMMNLTGGVQNYSAQSGIKYVGVGPQAAVEYFRDSIGKGVTFFKETLPGEYQKSLQYAQTGEIYTGKVDEAAGKQLGVFVDNFKPSEALFYHNTPVTVFGTLRAETLEAPIDIKVDCIADKELEKDKIFPRDTFQVLTFEEQDIDCVFNPGKLSAGTHSIAMNVDFSFTTRSYIRSYFMDQERLREYKRKNIDPLQGIAEKTPVAVFSQGPVAIGMDLGSVPIGIKSGEPGPTWGITLQNAWTGKIKTISGVYLYIPKGLAIDQVPGVDVAQITCLDLPSQEEFNACDDTALNVYTFTPEELGKEIYSKPEGLIVKTLRVYTRIEDTGLLLGATPLSVRNFRTTVLYDYVYSRETKVTIKEAPQ